MEDDERAEMPPTELEPSTMLEAIEPGMEVITRDGDRLGKVVKVYRPVGVDEMDSMSYDVTIQVGVGGLFGLADDLYIPSSVVRSIERGRIVLDVAKKSVPDMPWHKRETLPDDA